MIWFFEVLKIKEEEMDIEWSCDVRFIIFLLYGNEFLIGDLEVKIILIM